MKERCPVSPGISDLTLRYLSPKRCISFKQQRMYVLDHKRQLSLIGEMTQLRRDSNTWEVYYHHPRTNVMWKSYFPRATENNRGPKILRMEPVPDELDERLENCLAEEEAENAIGLGIELSATPGIWVSVMDILEQRYRKYHRRQLPLFLKSLKIEDYESLFEEIGYTLSNSDATKDDFEKLVKRSKKLRFKRFWFL